MKHTTLAVLLVVPLVCGALRAQDLRRVDTIVPALMKHHDVPGVALTVVRGDSVILIRGYGVARVRDSVRVDPERTLFRLASVAKLFVATAVMQQAESGRVDLHRDVNTYLAWRLPATHPEPVTLHHLLTHTAGFDERIIGYAAPSLDAIGALGEHLAANLPYRGWAPGDVIGYSNYGMSLAAHVVERTSGLAFDRYARERIFAPLGMSRTSYLRPPDSLTADLAEGHFCSATRCTPAPIVYSRPYPVGLAYSSARDMAQFLRAHVNGGAAGRARVLSAAWADTMQRQQFTADPALPGMSYGFFNQRNGGHALLSHAGNVPGFNNLLFLVPDARLGVYFVANGGRTAFGPALRDTLLRLLLPPATIPAAPVARVGDGWVESLAGTYQLARYAHRTLEAFPSLFATSVPVRADSGRLVLPYPNGALAFEPIDSLHFREVGGERVIAFRRDVTNRVTRLVAPIPVFGAELPGVLERRRWHEGARFMNEYVSWLAMGPLLLIVAFALVTLVAWWRRRRIGAVAPAGDRRAALVVWGAFAFVVLWLLFGFGFVARSVRMFESGTGLVFGVPLHMRLMAQVPWLLAALTAGLAVGAVAAWRSRWWWGWGDVVRRALISVFALVALFVVAFLVRWNYLPAVF